MASIRFEEETVNGLCCHSVDNLSFGSTLYQYRTLLLSAYGPKGGMIMISNGVGRNTLAASSSDITKQLSFGHPFFKYINALISAQNASCGLSGLYTGILCVRLLEEALKCEESTPYYVITDISEWMISQILTHMAHFPCQVVFDLDIGDMYQVTSFVKTILGSKNGLSLSKGEVDNLCFEIVKAFLKSIPKEIGTETFGCVHISLEGLPGSETRVYEGFLYREPNMNQELLRKMSEMPQVINVLLFAIPLYSSKGSNETLHSRSSHTQEEIFIKEVVVRLLPYLKENKVHVLANQKAIHPVIQFEIEREGYVVLDRLGTTGADTLIKLSGCQAITNISHLNQEINHSVIGKLSSMQHILLQEKYYILLKQETSFVSTLLLPGVSPSIEALLKETVESCLTALKMAVVDGKVVTGGGCLETWLAFQVRHLVSANLAHLMSMADVQSHHIFKVADAFIQTFMELAIQVGGGLLSTRFDWCVDSVFHHLWPSQVMTEELTLKKCDSKQIDEKLNYCICGLLNAEIIRNKYGGCWYEMDFHLNQNLSETSDCICETKTSVNNIDGEVNDQNLNFVYESISSSNFEDHDLFGIEVDSLDDRVVSVDEDVDSLEKSMTSLEEGGDSLEGRLESLDDDDVDSLEGVLDKLVEEPVQSKCLLHKMTTGINPQIQNILYDSYLAKYNAMRLAMEGFSQLFQIGQCVFDQ